MKKEKVEQKQIKKVTQYEKLQNRLTNKINPLFATSNGKNILDQLKSGENKYLKLNRIENAQYDPRWIEEIENCIPDLDAIIKNPKKVIENVAEVVPIELARKTNADSVKHLSTHSQYVKDINENGDVIPNKILNIRSDDFYQTYENRFIATLIRRLILFVEKRYQILLTSTDMKETEVIYYKNSSVVDGRTVEIETKVKVCSDIELSEENKNLNKTYISRIEEIRKYLLFFYDSEFMKMMKNERNVRNPIIMTNILRKNHIYNHAYQLYKFIEHYDLVGVELKVSDEYSKLTPEQLDEINNALLVSFLSLRCKDKNINNKTRIKKYRPTIITSIDDEAFVYGDYVSSPFEFVRVDNNHVKYIEATMPNIPTRPTKQEREYYAREIEQNKKKEAELANIRNLIKEKKRQEAIDNKRFEKIVQQRQEAEEKARLAAIAKDKQEKLNALEAARRALMAETNNASKSKKNKQNIAKNESVSLDETISDRYIIETENGYYVNDDVYVINKEEAKVFENVDEIKDIINKKGGKVVKL